ncbi:hypothetical protein BH11PSE8_BH11PSE8_32880 [soil metagenome]
MKFPQAVVFAALSAASAVALANVSVSASGSTTTYTENFNGGTSFSAGRFDTPFSSDDFLFLSVLAPSSSYSFTTAAPLASLSLSFWYSVPGAGNGTVSIAGSGPLPLADTPGNALQYLSNNPGSSSSGIGASYDAHFSTTLNNLAAGAYTVTFAKTPGLLTSLKVDDVQITTIAAAVPEPETYALLLAGLGTIACVVRRRSLAQSKD